MVTVIGFMDAHKNDGKVSVATHACTRLAIYILACDPYNMSNGALAEIYMQLNAFAQKSAMTRIT